jgi:protein-disulfide isomerase
MIVVMRHVAITAALLLGLACSAPAQQQAAAPQQPSGGDTAARIGNRTVTMKEVEDRWRENNPMEHAQAIQALYDGRRAALDAIVAEMLLEQAAKAQGVTPEQYTDAEVTKRVKPVTEADVVGFFQPNQNQMQGRGLQQMSAAIRRFLEDQQRATAQQALVAELRKKGPPISVLFDPPRSQVAVAADDAAQGATNAPVTIVEFSDFQCPFCQRVSPTLKRLKETYGDKIRIVWKDFPLTAIHPEAFKAAEAGNCAREQGKFWEYHDRLFANQQTLQPDALKTHAVASGLDPAKFNACLDSSKYSTRVQEHVGVGAKLGINSTPAVFINGRQVTGAQPYEVFAGIIDEELERTARR